MHPDLQMRALNRLPLSIRRIATLAAEPTRTFDQVERARIAMDNPTLTSTQRLGFLPLWYQILDPTRIPTPEVLEILDPNQNRGAAVDISCAAVALHYGGQSAHLIKRTTFS
ncbi:hypothetical protein FB45DRAFT_1024623 [Roridomyces roridus]|uniref:Uncharacterized protein n=1 Tax=Roridomyces roridus TaxID=1738132 RepID=A0AAD7C187_9AGAR|nr:hypothetical protein FB45DRAFT_1024623 [Roridomyces roridus]